MQEQIKYTEEPEFNFKAPQLEDKVLRILKNHQWRNENLKAERIAGMINDEERREVASWRSVMKAVRNLRLKGHVIAADRNSKIGGLKLVEQGQEEYKIFCKKQGIDWLKKAGLSVTFANQTAFINQN